MTLETELKKVFGANLWQYGEFEISQRVQVVVKMTPKKVLGVRKKGFPIAMMDSYTKYDAIKLVERIVLICQKYTLPYDLRVCLKLQTNITVTDMVFPKQSVIDYKANGNLAAIASNYHIVSGLK